MRSADTSGYPESNRDRECVLVVGLHGGIYRKRRRMTDKRPTKDIVVDERHRKDMGDLMSLMESIQDIGLLHPIVITPNGKLIAGNRRLEAYRALGEEEIPVTVVMGLGDAQVALCAEMDENTCRENMKPSENVSLGMALEELERPLAKERKAEAGKANLPTVSGDELPPLIKGRTRDIVGEALGVAGQTYQRAKTVVLAAQGESVPDEVREVAQEELKKMDQTGKIAPSYKAVIKAIQKANQGDDNSPPCFHIITERDRQRAESHRKRLMEGLSNISGSCQGLNTLRLDMAIAIYPEDERDGLTGLIKETITSFNKFTKALREEIKNAQ